MESRKLQKVGVDTLTVSLPAEWVRKRSLKRGDRMFLEEEGATLRLSTAQEIEGRRRAGNQTIVDADLCRGKGFLERVIVGNFVLGREKITVTCKRRITGEQLDEIRHVVRRLMGIGIIEETPTKVVLHCAIDPAHHPLDTLVKRLYQLGATMLQESLEALRTGDPALADEALAREEDSDMMYWLILRLVHSAQLDPAVAEQLGIRDLIEIPQYHLIARDLETVADHCSIIAMNVKDLLGQDARVPERLRRGYAAQAELIEKMYHKALAGLFSMDMTQANDAILLGKELAQHDTELIRTVVREVRDPRHVIPMRVISGRLARIGEYAIAIALVAFNRYLAKSTPVCRAEPPEKKPA